MEQEIARLRSELSQVVKDARGRREYGEEVKGAIVLLANRWQQAGKARAQLARQLGISDGTIAYWQGGKRPMKRVRLSEQVSGAPVTAGPVVVVLPGGARIENVSSELAVEFARALSC